MKIGTQLEDLQKKIKKQHQYKKESHKDGSGGYLFIDPKKKPEKNDIKGKLDFLKRLLKMINEDATGFDLAYEVEKNQEIKRLIYDGVLFYNTFLEVGNVKFIDAPDKMTKDYKSFKTVEDTEKYMFMVWLNETISTLQKDLDSKGDYAKYIEGKLREQLTHCKNCGARVQDIRQELCEVCGENLMEQIH